MGHIRFQGCRNGDHIVDALEQQKCSIAVLAGLVPFGGCKGEFLLCLSPGFWWLPEIFGVPWLVAASLQSLLCLHMAIFPVCVCLQPPSPFSYRDISHWLWSQPSIQDDLILRPLIISAKTQFPNKVPGLDMDISFGGHYSTRYRRHPHGGTG